LKLRDASREHCPIAMPARLAPIRAGIDGFVNLEIVLRPQLRTDPRSDRAKPLGTRSCD
jgi:hypothetical protein